MPSQAGTGAATTSEAYSTVRHIEQLCDGSYLTVVQTAVGTLKLIQITSPSGTPAFTTLTQTFSIAGGSNTIGDLFILNNGTTTSDVWLVYSDNSTTTGLFVAHGTYTASGSTWSWDNTGTSISLGSYTGGFMLPSLVWTGSNLIVVTRANISNYGIGLTATTTKNGTSGWSALVWLDGSGLGSHCYPLLRHDATNGCTLCVYTLANDTVWGRVIADGSAPGTVANWSSATALSGTVGVGAANLSATLDTANKRLHVAYGNSSVGTNPQYNSATYTITTISAGVSFSVDSGATTFTAPMIGLDNASPPSAYVFWATGAVGSASDIDYAKIASPYSSAGSVTNLTNASSNDNAYPHVPANTPMAGYVPLLYAHAVSPWAVEYDNSITLSVTVTGSATLHGQGALTAAGSATGIGAATLAGHGALTASGLVVITAAATCAGHGVLTASQYPPGTGIGDLAVSTQTQTWVNSGSGTETDITYVDTSGSGWELGINPGYGGGVVSAWYERNNGAVAGAGTLLSNGSQTDLYTVDGGGGANPDGWTHSLEESASVTFNGGFDGSETYPFSSAGMLQELAPTGTAFRRAYLAKVNEDVALATGLKVHVTTCVYPGDPGMIVDRIDWINPTGAAIVLSSLNLTPLGGLLDTSATPPGAWTHTNAQAGSVGGTPASIPSSNTSGEPDYFFITPSSGNPYGQKVGLVAVKGTVLGSSGYNWSTVFSYNESTTGGTSNDRLKVFYQTGGGSYTIPAGTTQSYYVLKSLRRSLTSTDAAAIAADYLNPGALTVTAGTAVTQTSDTPAGRTASAFAWSERAWVVQANATAGVNVTLDMSPAHVTTRFKPVFKLTSWNDSAPIVTWGGSAQAAGVDYRHVEDTSAHICYVQLYFDVVASGATIGQRNNAALGIQPSVVSGAATFSGQGRLTDAGVESFAGAATLKGHGALTAAGVQVLTGVATLKGQGKLVASGLQVLTGVATLKGQGKLVASGFSGQTGAATLKGHGALTAAAVVTDIAAATLHGHGALTAQAQIIDIGVATLHGHGALVAAGFVVMSEGVTAQGRGALTALGVQVLTGAVVNRGHGQLTVADVQVVTGSATLKGHGALTAAGGQAVTASATLHGQGVLRVSSSQIVGAAAVAQGRGRLLATGITVISKAAVLSGQGRFSVSSTQVSKSGTATLKSRGALLASGFVLLTGAASLQGRGRLLASLAPSTAPSGVSVTMGAGAPVGLSVREE